MPKVRKEIPELEKLVQVGRKKFVRYEEGAQLYSMGLHTFQELAKDAKAVYHVKRVVLVNTEIVDENQYPVTEKEDINSRSRASYICSLYSDVWRD